MQGLSLVRHHPSRFFEMTEKRPRQYAAEIAALPTRQERAAALAGVPAHLRDMVRAHVQTAFALSRRKPHENVAR
jgi:hypothetical protein